MECEINIDRQNRKEEIRAVQNSLDVLSGRWKIAILSSIYYHHKRRFRELLNDVEGISNKMLSKELKELESNKLVKRTVPGKHPMYELSEEGLTLKPIINHMTEWGRCL